MILLWPLIAVALWVKFSSASFHDTRCSIWPNKNIEYCFDSSVSVDIQRQFNVAIKRWTKYDVPITYTFMEEGCPERTNQNRNRQYLVVSAQRDSRSMSSSYGYIKPTAQNGYKFAELKIGLAYKPHYTYSRSLGHKYVSAIAHELGHVMCLLNENQRPDLARKLELKCENLIDYQEAKTDNEKAKIKWACSSAQRAGDAKSIGALNYAPYPADSHFSWSHEVDYDSIMFNDGRPLAQVGLTGAKRVILDKNKLAPLDGRKLISKDWAEGPSVQDLTALIEIWGESAPTIADLNDEEPVPSYENPPGYSSS